MFHKHMSSFLGYFFFDIRLGYCLTPYQRRRLYKSLKHYEHMNRHMRREFSLHSDRECSETVF